MYLVWMNLMVWILMGGLVGAYGARFFGSSYFLTLGNFIIGLGGALGGGFLASKYIPETLATDLDMQSFSPGGLVVSFFVSLIVLAVFNSIT